MHTIWRATLRKDGDAGGGAADGGEAAPGMQRWVAGSRTNVEDRLLRVCCGRLGKSCHACRAAAVRAVAQRQSKKVLAVASLPRSEGSSNHEQRAVCRDGPVWAQSCSFTEIYVAGIKGGSPWPQRTGTLAGGAHLAVAAVHGLVMEDAARGDGCAIHSSLAVNKRGGGALGRASGRREQWQTAVADRWQRLAGSPGSIFL